MNAIQKATTNAAVKADSKPTMQQYIKQMEGEIKKALPSVMTPERFTRIVFVSTEHEQDPCTDNSTELPWRYDDRCTAWRRGKHSPRYGIPHSLP